MRRLIVFALVSIGTAFCQYSGTPGTTTTGIGQFLLSPYVNVDTTPIVYNPTATVTDAQLAAQTLANRTAYWVIQLNPIAGAVLRFTVPQGSMTFAHNVINFPVIGTSSTTAGQFRPWASSNPASPYYAATNICWGIVTVYPQGCWDNTWGNSQASTFGSGGGVGQAINANPVLLNTYPALLDKFAQQLASDYLDSQLAGLYAQFTSHTPVGTGGSALTDATLGKGIVAINTDATYTPGESIYIVLGEEALQPWYQTVFTNGNAYTKTPGVNDFQAFFKRGIPLVSGQAALGGQVTTPFEVIISSQVPHTGTSPVARHGFAFSPTAIIMVSQTPNPGEDINNVSGGGVIPAGFALASSQNVNNFISTIKYSTTAVSGNNFSFAMDCVVGAGISSNRHGVRVEY